MRTLVVSMALMLGFAAVGLGEEYNPENPDHVKVAKSLRTAYDTQYDGINAKDLKRAKSVLHPESPVYLATVVMLDAVLDGPPMKFRLSGFEVLEINPTRVRAVTRALPTNHDDVATGKLRPCDCTTIDLWKLHKGEWKMWTSEQKGINYLSQPGRPEISLEPETVDDLNEANVKKAVEKADRERIQKLLDDTRKDLERKESVIPHSKFDGGAAGDFLRRLLTPKPKPKPKPKPQPKPQSKSPVGTIS
jgi:hypothetical protein